MKKNKTDQQNRGTAQSSPKPVAPSAAAAPPGKEPPPATTSGFKSFILLVVAVISMLIFFGLEPNKLWLNQRILPYWEDFKEQKLNLDIEERKIARYQTDYLFAKNVSNFFEKRGSASKVLVLMPPNEYFKAHNLDIHVVEPEIFYYLTGLKTIWVNNRKAATANWFISVKNGGLVFDSVTNKQILLDTIAAFNKYKISL